MALKKKNVFQGFIPDDYVPSGDQQIVKYLLGKGNNLHEVESPNGSIFLVTMPKKFRQTVWLKKGDCIVIDPISEGKKVLGEIICVVPSKSVVEMIMSGEWIPKLEGKNVPETNIGAGDGEDLIQKSLEERTENFLVEFYSTGGKSAPNTDSCMPPSDSEDSSTEEEEPSDHEEDESSKTKSCKGDVEVQIGNHSNHQEGNLPTSTEEEDDGYRSRVQFLTSGIVTVTNVVNDISSLNPQNGLQSLDFETEDSSLESQQQNRTQQNDNDNTVHRKANTIRIQVNYPPESDPASSNPNSNISHRFQNLDLKS